MNYFHVFGKGREAIQTVRQSVWKEGGRGVASWGRARVGTLFQIISIVGVYSVQLHAGIMQISQFSPLSSAAVAE